MVGPNLRDQLPILKSVVKWFSKDSVTTDSLVFRLHHQVTTFLILIGFVFTVIENYIDSKTITCHGSGQLPKYAHAYCWIHGAAYVREHLQGRATGCYVDPKEVDTHEDFLVTSYYLWLPYLLSFLFAMAKMPHSMWKRFFENNLLSSILGMPSLFIIGWIMMLVLMIGGMAGGEMKDQAQDQQQQQQQQGGQEGGEEEEGEGENKEGGENKGKKKQENNNTGKKNKNNNNNKNQKQPARSPAVIARSFVQLRGESRYNRYQFHFLMLEASNLLTLMAQILVTHWILNYKFWDYGARVLQYLTVYGEHWKKGENLHNPMCELFPTEVSCNIRTGAATGGIDKTNYLCILQNNLFNQKYFFILWLWWIFLFIVTGVGVSYRITRLLLKPFSRYMVERKVHGYSHVLNQMIAASSGDFFVLELVIDSLKDNPQDISELLNEVGRVWRNGQNPQYEKLRTEPNKRVKIVNLVPADNYRPPPYPSQKQV